jgi:hypothetical protein
MKIIGAISAWATSCTGGAELAALDAALTPCWNRRSAGSDDLVDVELGQFGEVAHLGEHDLVHAGRRVSPTALPPDVAQRAQQVGRAAFEAADEVCAFGDQLARFCRTTALNSSSLLG